MAYDVVIIGGGPTGASAAIFTARAGLSTLVLDAGKGITPRAMVHNHLGYVDGVTGTQLVADGKAQAIAAGAEWREVTATAISSSPSGVVVTTEAGESIDAVDVILALGVNAAIAKDCGMETCDGTEPRIPTNIVVDRDGRTALAHVWAAGTIAGTSVHTIITAGDGARVAINIASERRGERYVDHDMIQG